MRCFLFLLMAACVAMSPIQMPESGTPWARCYTPCGMRTNAGNCEALQRYEQRVIQRLARAIPEWREEKVCAALRGYEIKVERHGDRAADSLCSDQAWYSPVCNECVIGCTDASPRTISLATDDWQHSALAHEISHVADDMKAGHCPWAKPELQAALYELAGFVDPSGPEPMCSH